MPQSSMTHEEILKAFEAVHINDLYQTRETVYARAEGVKAYTSVAGVKMPARGTVAHLDPFSVTLADFHDRKFGHSYGITRDKDGAVVSIGHIEQLALQIHDQGQLEDAAAVLRRRGEGFGVQVWRGAGRTLAARLLVLSGVVPDAQLRVKVVDVISTEEPEPETLKSLMSATVNANLQVAGYSPVDKANIFAQMKDGGYSGVVFTQEEIARTFGVTPASISQLLNITAMIPELQRLIHEDRLGYARALSLKLHKLSPEQQARWVGEFLDSGKAKGKHAGNGGGEEKPATPKQIVSALIVWCDDVINSTAHKSGSKAIARELRDALTAAAGPNIRRLDDTVEEHTKSR